MKKRTLVLIIWLCLCALLVGLIWLSTNFFPVMRPILSGAVLIYCILTPAVIALLQHLKQKGK